MRKLLVILITASLSSCALLSEDLTEAKHLVLEKKYNSAISLLNTYNSNSSKRYNSRVHVEYGVSKLANLDAPKDTRYEEARELFEEALRLDPKNNKARTYYLMILKTIDNA